MCRVPALGFRPEWDGQPQAGPVELATGGRGIACSSRAGHVTGYITAEHKVLLPCAPKKEGPMPNTPNKAWPCCLSTVGRARPPFKKNPNDIE